MDTELKPDVGAWRLYALYAISKSASARRMLFHTTCTMRRISSGPDL